MRARSFPALGVGTPLIAGLSPSEYVDYAVAADRAGLDDVSVGELRSTEVFSLAAAMVAATNSVRVETSIVAAVTRAPTLLAMAASTLGQLSAGRFHLGVGAGSPIVAGWHGRDFARPLDMVATTVRALQSALAGERLEDFGQFRLSDEMVRSVPVVLSAMNPRMLRLAAEVAQGVVLQFCGSDRVREMAADARAHRHAVGVTEDFEVIANVWAYAGPDRDLATRAFRREVAPYLAVPTYRAAAVALSSESEVMAASEAWHRAGRDAAAEHVPQSIVDELLFVLDDNDVPDRVVAMQRAGCDRLRFIPLAPVTGDPGDAHAVIDAVAALREA